MGSSALAMGVRRLRSLAAGKRDGNDSDERLLHAFLTRRDEGSFAALVRRHGPMVLQVCRHVSGHQQDAEDAFQATFLVLARNAAALRNPTALASFLRGTAYRIAMKTKQSAARRRIREARTPARAPANPSGELLWREVRALLDEEIARLPEIYRSSFVLCCLESVSQVEAARRLGLKEGTLSSRLAEARKRLQRRLTRRGVELSAVLAVTTLATRNAPALPLGLLTNTTRTALSTSGISPVVAALAEMGLGASKVKVVTALLLAISMLTGAGLWACQSLAVPTPTLAVSTPEAKADKKAPTAPGKREPAKTVEIQGRVFGPDGKPKAGSKLLLLDEGDKTVDLGTTKADGRFTIAVPKTPKDRLLIAKSDDTGIDFLHTNSLQPGKPVEFRLVKDRPIRGHIINTEGKPVAGARVAVRSLSVYANNSMDTFLSAWKKRHFMSGIPSGVESIWSELGDEFAATTDKEGRFVLRGLGDERLVSLRVRGKGIANDELWVVTRGNFDPKPYNRATLDNIPKGMENFSSRWMLHGPEFSVVAEAEKVLHGVVKDTDTGKGRPGVLVQHTRNGDDLVRVTVEARTDAQGRFEIHGARKSKRYMLEVRGDVDAGYLPSQVWADDTAGYQSIRMDLPVKKGVIVTGKMLDGKSGKPVSGHAMAAVLNNNPFLKNYPSFGNSAFFPMQHTKADGTFRVVTIPGHVLLMGGPDDWTIQAKFKAPGPDPKYPQYFTKDPNFVAYYNPGGSMSPIQGCYCKVLEIKADAKVVDQDIVLERASVLTVRIQDADGKPLADVWVGGSSPQDWYPPIQCKEAECSAYGIQAGKPRLLAFYHPKRKLAAAVTLKGDEKAPVVVKLTPAATIKGRLLDADGKPLAGVVVDLHYRQRVASEVHNVIHHAKQIVTDANGAFALDELIGGVKFNLSFRQDQRTYERETKPAAGMDEVTPGKTLDLGEIRTKPWR
jgi:RNA polymerase sigma factor (sigma-70 family)